MSWHGWNSKVPGGAGRIRTKSKGSESKERREKGKEEGLGRSRGERDRPRLLRPPSRARELESVLACHFPASHSFLFYSLLPPSSSHPHVPHYLQPSSPSRPPRRRASDCTSAHSTPSRPLDAPGLAAGPSEPAAVRATTTSGGGGVRPPRHPRRQRVS